MSIRSAIPKFRYAFMAIFAGISIFSCQKSFSQEERFMVFTRKLSDGNVHFFRYNIESSAVSKKHEPPILAIYHFSPADLNVDGGFTDEARQRLFDAEDYISESISQRISNSASLAIKTDTVGRSFVFSANKQTELLNVVNEVLLKQKGNWTVVPLQSWHEFEAEFVPTPVESKLSGDLSVIMELEKAGDKLNIKRPVEFWFYGQQDKLEELMARLISKEFYGMNISRGSGEANFKLTGFRKQNVLYGTFEEITPKLMTISAGLKVDYDGWETQVVKSEQDAKID